jgi:hypothetical protein
VRVAEWASYSSAENGDPTEADLAEREEERVARMNNAALEAMGMPIA